MADSGSPDGGFDLLVVTLSGVQRFIAESRTTSDLRAGSAIVAGLAAHAAKACGSAVPGVEVVFPAAGEGSASAGMPNRVVARIPAGQGAHVASAVARAVTEDWERQLRLALQVRDGAEGVPATPGMPDMQWVCVPAGNGSYADQWHEAHAVLAARKRIHVFENVDERGRDLCQLSPRWPAQRTAPPGARRHERNERLSAASWAKRILARIPGGLRDQQISGFPSTASIASALYRREVLRRFSEPRVAEAVGALRSAVRQLDATGEAAVPGLPRAGGELGEWFRSSAGPWVYQERWISQSLDREYKTDRSASQDFQRNVAQGRACAEQLQRLMATQHHIAPPASYLAVVVQDVDGMGRFLGGEGPDAMGRFLEVTPAEHGRISGLLRDAAFRQRDLLESEQPGLLGVTVYAGGDDVMALTAAATALQAAEALQEAVPPALPRASTAVMFFHYGAALRQAVTEGRALLERGKETVTGKHALAVGFMRRSGFREHSIQPWMPGIRTSPPLPGADGDSPTAAASFRLFSRDRERQLSPNLVTVLERDGSELARINSRRVYQAEIRRLVLRHGGDFQDADALVRLGRFEHAGAQSPAERETRQPAPAARVAVFLRQECR